MGPVYFQGQNPSRQYVSEDDLNVASSQTHFEVVLPQKVQHGTKVRKQPYSCWLEVPEDVGWDRKGSPKPNLHVCGEDDTKKPIYNMEECVKREESELLNEWFIHPIVYGESPRTMQDIVGYRLPKFTKEEVKMVKGSMDFVGINQYTAYYIYDPHKSKPKVLGYQQDWNARFAYKKKGVPIGPKANSYWLYNVPWGLYKAITYIKEHYGNPTVILSENGMDDPGNVTISKGLHDTTRINFYKGYLTQLKKAVDEGANVVGYFEWRLGYTSRFGIVYVDFANLKRYPKMPAYWFKRLLQRNKH